MPAPDAPDDTRAPRAMDRCDARLDDDPPSDDELRAIERALVATIAPDKQPAALSRMLAALTPADRRALRRALDCSDPAGPFLALLRRRDRDRDPDAAPDGRAA